MKRVNCLFAMRFKSSVGPFELGCFVMCDFAELIGFQPTACLIVYFVTEQDGKRRV